MLSEDLFRTVTNICFYSVVDGNHFQMAEDPIQYEDKWCAHNPCCVCSFHLLFLFTDFFSKL